MNIYNIQQIKTSCKMLLCMTIIVGVCYTLAVTALGQILFPKQANGSLLQQNGQYIASELIGQEFRSAKYFWGRPSATHPYPYNAANSGGSNLGPLNPILLTEVQQRVKLLQKLNPNAMIDIPIELVTASASGLDPEISLRSAVYQVPRIAAARKIDRRMLHKLIFAQSHFTYLNVYSVPRVNVILINLALDKLSKEMQ